MFKYILKEIMCVLVLYICKFKLKTMRVGIERRRPTLNIK